MSRKVMIIDDSKDMRQLMILILSDRNFEVSVASEGNEALLKLKTEPLPNLILLDHNMHGMDGPTFLQEIQKQLPNVYKQVPIVLTTALDRDSIKCTGATEIFIKNGDLDAMLNLINKYVP